MSDTTVAVVCPDCDGSTNGPHGFCAFCMAQGHIRIDRAPDGSVPTHDESGRPLREWVPLSLPEVAPNPLTLTYQRCVP